MAHIVMKVSKRLFCACMREAPVKSEIHMFHIVLYVHIFSRVSSCSFLACSRSIYSKTPGRGSYCYDSSADERRERSLLKCILKE